jgi:hypothetical protein
MPLVAFTSRLTSYVGVSQLSRSLVALRIAPSKSLNSIHHCLVREFASPSTGSAPILSGNAKAKLEKEKRLRKRKSKILQFKVRDIE